MLKHSAPKCALHHSYDFVNEGQSTIYEGTLFIDKTKRLSQGRKP